MAMSHVPVPRECLLNMIAVCMATARKQPGAMAAALERLAKHAPEMRTLADQLDPVRR